MPEEIKIGDVVQLKSGGPKMTVATVGKAELEPDKTFANCTWFEGSTVKTGPFYIEMLDKCDC